MNNKIIIPENCPFCGTKTEMQDSRLVCPNNACPETLAHKLVAFSEGIGVKGLGLETAKLLFSDGVTNPLKLITQSREDMVRCCGKVGENLQKEYAKKLTASNRISEVDFLVSQTIPNISRHTAELILSKFKIEDFYNPFGELSFDLTVVEGIGEITAKSLAEFFSVHEICIKNLMLRLQPIRKTIEVNDNSVIKGFSIVETGYGFIDGTKVDRIQFKEILVANGATLKSGVSKKTDILVVGTEGIGATKIAKAEELGIKIMQFNDFIEFIEFIKGD